MSSHPDKQFYSYIIRGISKGFKIGFDHRGRRKAAKSNMLSAQRNPDVVDDYLRVELEEGRVVGPIAQANGLHINRSPSWKVEVDCRLVPSRRGKYK